MKVLETDRLELRWLSTEDVEFILELLNEPSFLRFIGDKGVRNLDDARDYISKGPTEMYHRLGFGLYLTALKDGGVQIGICGLIKRAGLEYVDIGFAFLQKYHSKGYAYEAAAAVKDYGKNFLSLDRIVAITTPDNYSSRKVLEKLGMRFERMIRLTGDSQELMLFVVDL